MTAQRTVWYVVFGCLVYAAALIAMLPAAWMAQFAGRASKQTLLLREPAGTAWSGSGRMYVRERAGTLLDIGALRWSTSLSGILTGKLAVDLVLGDSASIARIELSPASLAIRGLSLELPGRVLSSIAPALEALGPQGKLLLKSDSLRLDGDSAFGLASVEWRPVRLARAPGLNLGSHVARLRGGGNKIDIELGTIDGPLRLSGGGTWTRERGLQASAAAEHGENVSAAMAPFLQGVCSSYANRRCEFRLTQ